MTNELCSEKGCEREVAVVLRGLCNPHFQQWARRNKPRGTKPCTVEGCDNTYYAKGFCNKHYGMYRTYGQPVAPPRPVVMCKHHPSRESVGRELCGSCYQRWYKGQEGPAKEQRRITYWAAHHRAVRANGKASLHLCVWEGCEEQAKDWALKHDSSERRVETHGSQAGRVYSMSVDDYQPMCRAHHKQYDWQLRKAQRDAA